MSQETSAILRTILYQVETASTLEQARTAVKVMCTKDDIAAVRQEIAELAEKENDKKLNN